MDRRGGGEQRRRRRRGDEYREREKRVRAGHRSRAGTRVASGARLEKGGASVYAEERVSRWARWAFWKRREDGDDGETKEVDDGSSASRVVVEAEMPRRRKRRRRYLIIGGLMLLVIIAIVVGVVVAEKKKEESEDDSTTTDDAPANTNLDGVNPDEVPAVDKDTWLDPFSWYDTTDFNVTFTNVTVGGLPIIGLNSTWDDKTRANDNVPPLNETWEYGTIPIRGINVGGWFVLEPIITPSYFSSYATTEGVIDEWTLSEALGTATAKKTIEEHYSSFINESDFAAMQAAGFDHVRIPFGYWAITSYDDDPLVTQVAWRYLLRAIEWCRRYGLRVNLDLHGAPGSQNGWNHSGRQGLIRWLNGTDGTLNGERTTDIHGQLSAFFAQDRYKNIISIYGLLNEPRMTELVLDTVLDWIEDTVAVIRDNGMNATISVGDGFLGLANWQGKLQNISGLVLDAHQYVIFNTEYISYDHHNKTNFACAGWTEQAVESMDNATGFGPTLFGEWSQADTDCATYLNDVDVGTRWEGTLDEADTPGSSSADSVLTPQCPTADGEPACSCTDANADPAAYSALYKQWLRQFAEAQMESFEYGWGWFYWTWKTESATQWSYKDGLAAGILPDKPWERAFNCSAGIPKYAELGLPEYY